MRRKKCLEITGCRDSQMWYSNKIGKTVPLVKEESTEKENYYLSRETLGFINIVFKQDAKIVLV